MDAVSSDEKDNAGVSDTDSRVLVSIDDSVAITSELTKVLNEGEAETATETSRNVLVKLCERVMNTSVEVGLIVLVSIDDSVAITSELTKVLNEGEAETATETSRNVLVKLCEGVMNTSVEVGLIAGRGVDVATSESNDVSRISKDNVGVKNDVSIPLPMSEVSTTMELLGTMTEVVSSKEVVSSVNEVAPAAIELEVIRSKLVSEGVGSS